VKAARLSETEQNRAIALEFVEALTSNDIERIERLFHEEAEWWVLGAGTMSRQALIKAIAQQFSTVVVSQMNILGTTAEGERVAIEAEGNFEFADGKVYRNRYHLLLIVRAGRVVHGREYLDTALLARVFGPST
jgi:ketosteroid isomerase-like protein